MINVKNRFQGDSLEIEFSGESIEEKAISVQVANDVNFKPVISYLIEIIPNKTKLDFSFEDFEGGENEDKFNLIKETIEEIYKEFNVAIDNMFSEEDNEQEGNEKDGYSDDTDTEDDDLPF